MSENEIVSENELELITRSDAISSAMPRWELENQIKRIWNEEDRNVCIEVFHAGDNPAGFYVLFRASEGKITGINLYRRPPHYGITTKTVAKGLSLEEALEKLRSEIEEGYVTVDPIEL